MYNASVSGRICLLDALGGVSRADSKRVRLLPPESTWFTWRCVGLEPSQGCVSRRTTVDPPHVLLVILGACLHRDNPEAISLTSSSRWSGGCAPLDVHPPAPLGGCMLAPALPRVVKMVRNDKHGWACDHPRVGLQPHSHWHCGSCHHLFGHTEKPSSVEIIPVNALGKSSPKHRWQRRDRSGSALSDRVHASSSTTCHWKRDARPCVSL